MFVGPGEESALYPLQYIVYDTADKQQWKFAQFTSSQPAGVIEALNAEPNLISQQEDGV